MYVLAYSPDRQTPLPLPGKPVTVWAVTDHQTAIQLLRGLMLPQHGINATILDGGHDWSWRGGNLRLTTSWGGPTFLLLGYD
jgi:hypothetical protein